MIKELTKCDGNAANGGNRGLNSDFEENRRG